MVDTGTDDDDDDSVVVQSDRGSIECRRFRTLDNDDTLVVPIVVVSTRKVLADT